MTDIATYSSFITQLAARLEPELAEAIELMDDPGDETEIVPVYLSIKNWRTAIRNLTTLAGLLDSLASLEAGNG